MKRRDKVNYYLDLAEVVSQRGTCLRKQYGAVIVKTMKLSPPVMSAPPHAAVPTASISAIASANSSTCRGGERYELCRSVHAEANAIISASRERMLGSAIYLTGIDLKDNGNYVKNANPCSMCKRMIINAGIETVYIRDDKDNYRVIKVQEYIEDDESLRGQLGY